jgi:DNA-binding ferritin-like protein
MDEVIITRKTIIRFDEVMLDKASKMSLQQLKLDCKQSYTEIRDFQDLKYDTLKYETTTKKEIQFIQHLLDTTQDTLFEKLSNSMDKYAKMLNASYGMPVDAEELKLHLA